MKRLFLIPIVIILNSYNSYCQDLIIKNYGDTLFVSIYKLTPETVEFKYPGENVINLINKESVYKIVLESGRVETFSNLSKLPKINSKRDWKKVIVTLNNEDVAGLIECGSVKGYSGWGGVASVKGGEQAKDKMRKDAAKMGASIILITKGWHYEKNKPISGYGRGVRLEGIAYK